MVVGKNSVVTVEYKVWDAQGDTIDDGEKPMVYLHGGYGDLFVPLEEALEGKSIGEEVWIQVEPEDAFGDYDADMVRIEDLEQFPENIEVGMQFESTEEGEDFPEDESLAELWTVTEIADGKVVLDGNHPLAGVALRYHLIVRDIRPATEEEQLRGSIETSDDFVVKVGSGSVH